MRVATALVIATTALSLVSNPTLAQTDGGKISTLHMLDSLRGWAVTTSRWATSTPTTPLRPILRTTDGGETWKNVSPTWPPQASQIYVGPAAFLTPSVAWVTMAYDDNGRGINELFRTVDSGQTWSSIRVPGISAVHFVTPQNGWLITDAAAFMGGNEEVNVYRSTDGGETWIKVASACVEGTPICKNAPANVNSGLGVGGHKSNITFSSTRTGWITGTVLYVTHDAGRTWREQMLTLPSRVTLSWQQRGVNGYYPPRFFTAQDGIMPVLYFSDQTDSAVVLAAVYATHDGGTTWRHTAPVSITRGRLDCGPYYLCAHYRPINFADANNGWLVDRETLYMTGDGGQRWMTVRDPLFADVRDLQFISPQIGWAVRQSAPFLLKTLDGGRTWTPVTYTISRQ